MAEAAAASEGRKTRQRWVICALLFTAVVINYVDRQMLGVLKPFISEDLGWSETDYADIVFYFQAAYAVSYLLFGAFVDRVGAKIGYATAFIIWQVAHIAHAGANIGAIITPLAAPAIMLLWGWQAAFVITGLIGLLWLVAWFALYNEPRKARGVNAAELAHIEQDPADDEKKVGWFSVLTRRETWAYALGKFLIDPVWWMLLFWLPDFFKKTFDLKLSIGGFHLGEIGTYGLVLAIVYIISDVGSVGGGWLSSRFMTMGWSINRARKTTLLIFAIGALPYFMITGVTNLWVATLLVGWLAAVHQAFSANLYTLPSDVFPRKAVGSVIGIGGMVGGIGGMVMAKSVGHVLEGMGGYGPIFAVCGGVYLLAILVIHLLTPKMEPVAL